MYIKQVVLAVMVIAVSAVAVAAQCSDADQQALEKFDRDWGKHSDSKNRAALEQIYADDFMSIGLIEMTGKKEAIDNTMNADTTNQPDVSYDNYMITCTSNTATVTHRNVVKTMADGKESVSYGRSIHVLEKRNGRWQVVSTTGHPMNDDVATVMNKEMDGYQAYLRRDIEWFEKNTADNYIGINAEGKTHNKAQMIEIIKNDKNKYEMVKLSDVSVRNDGDMAVITGVYKIKGMSADGKPMKMKIRFTRTLARKDGNWQAIAGQSTIVNDN